MFAPNVSESPNELAVFYRLRAFGLYVNQRQLNYPIVNDDADESILSMFRDLGVNGFPAYILVGPDGRVIMNDRAVEGENRVSLGTHKIEVLRELFLMRSEEDAD